MSSEPSIVIAPPAPKHLCPICGQPSYSLGGVHPQCAIEQADAPRILKLRAKKAIAAAAPKSKKNANAKWSKRCPECGLESHVRRKMCSCGHNFSPRSSD